jgi:OOP family OmpA-OmpF porin
VVWLAGWACAARVPPPAPAPAVVRRSSADGPPPRPTDRDGDGIPDDRDQCPDQPETVNGCRDDDGCPDQFVVMPHTAHFTIVDQIFFAAGSAKIRTAEPPHVSLLVDAVAATLNGNPDLGPLEVRGHAAADERRPARLADARAAAVVDALVARGVAREQLTARGVGATMPICKERSEECHSRCRRVEFIIVKQPAPLPPPPMGPHDCGKVLVSQARGMMPP